MGGAYRCIGFVDDAQEKHGTTRHGYPVLSRRALTDCPDSHVLAVPGSPVSYRNRQQIIDGLEIAEDRFARVIHPSARISPLAVIGQNVLLMAGVVVTSNAQIGDHVCVLPNTVIHHDTVIGPWSLIGSNVTIAGNTVIGQCCYVGSGTSVMNGLRVGSGTLVGLGSTVIRDIPEGSVVAGNPARSMR